MVEHVHVIFNVSLSMMFVSYLHVGALTKNIVAMKQRLEGDLAQSVGQQQSDQPTISEAQRRKEREMVAREVRTLTGYTCFLFTHIDLFYRLKSSRLAFKHCVRVLIPLERSWTMYK